MKECQATSCCRLPVQAGKKHLSLCFPRLLFSWALLVRKADKQLTTSVMTDDFILAVAAEMASGIDAAVECWMTQVERALENTNLTTLGRLQAVQEILATYKRLTGKAYLVRAVSSVSRQTLGVRDVGPDQT